MFKQLKEKLTGPEAKDIIKNGNKMMAFRIFNVMLKRRGEKYFKKAGKRVGLELIKVTKVNDFESVLCYCKRGQNHEAKISNK